ncbi:Tetracycline resistance protein, class A [Linum perenne]
MEKLWDLGHLFMTVFLSTSSSMMVIPAITDVTMEALCPGKDECSVAIYLSGLQQAVIGLGTVVMMPVIGNLSDKYGRKTLLTFPLTLSIFPLVILAYSRTTEFFYAYYILRTLTAMLSEGSLNCLALAYVADSVSESKRTSAFGILAGVGSAAFVGGTLAARFLSTDLAFQVAAALSMVAAVYMRIFLKENKLSVTGDEHHLIQPILKKTSSDDGEESCVRPTFKTFPSVSDLISLLKTNVTFSQAAIVTFFQSLADGGIQGAMLYYLKARFHFSKNQYADLILIASLVGMVSQNLFSICLVQLILMPIVAPFVAEHKLLSISLLVGCANTLVLSIAWSEWVPYATAVFATVVVLATPCLRSIASKQVGSRDQGKAQGCLSGISSIGSIISPLIFSSLTAMFLSEQPPFDFPGFSIMCMGLMTMIALIQSLMMKGDDYPISSRKITDCPEAIVVVS